MDELGGQLPTKGTKFRTKAELETDTDGFLVKSTYTADRTPNIEVTYYGWVPGAGGDIWWMEHEDGTIQAYCYTELEKAT
ncbi:hypothetical protein [Hydrogenophaga sp.]|uniref:hypothetical protein n=1 Tax=Hydrogenophaga sp. TaxID=1904254 RepID=UPI002617F875|nr:hypothetical protein [Hydrogenophaga sp.]